MIDERELIRTLLQWKENGNKFAGLKEEAMIDKVIAEVTNMPKITANNIPKITVTDILDHVKNEMCIAYCKYTAQCETALDNCRGFDCPLDRL